MIAEKDVTILNSLGLHVRPSAAMAGMAAKFKCTVSVVKDGQAVNAKSSIDLLTLAAVAGTELRLRAEGDDAREAVDALAALIQTKFGED